MPFKRAVSPIDIGSKVIYNGQVGTVKYIHNGVHFAVEFTDEIVGGHDCRGHCKDNHGWWVLEEDMELFYDKPLADGMTYEDLMKG